MIAPLHRESIAERAAQTVLAASKAVSKTPPKRSGSATKSSAEKANRAPVFYPGDVIECLQGSPNDWPIGKGKLYLVAVDVIAAFDHRGPANGVILDPCPNRHGVSDGPKHPYVWDNERFSFFRHPYDGRPVITRNLVPPTHPDVMESS